MRMYMSVNKSPGGWGGGSPLKEKQGNVTIIFEFEIHKFGNFFGHENLGKYFWVA